MRLARPASIQHISEACIVGICSKINGGDQLWQSRPSMAAIDGQARSSMATKSAMDGPAGPIVAGNHLQHDRSFDECTRTYHPIL